MIADLPMRSGLGAPRLAFRNSEHCRTGPRETPLPLRTFPTLRVTAEGTASASWN